MEVTRQGKREGIRAGINLPLMQNVGMCQIYSVVVPLSTPLDIVKHMKARRCLPRLGMIVMCFIFIYLYK